MTSSESAAAAGRSPLPPRPWAVGEASALGRVFAKALASGGSWAELFHERRVDGAVTLSGPDQRSHSTGLTAGVGLRVVGADTACHVFTNLDDEHALDELATQAAEVFALLSAETPPAISNDAAAALVAAHPAVSNGVTADAAGFADLDDAVCRGLDPRQLEQRAMSAFSCAMANGPLDTVRVRLSGWLREITVVGSDGSYRRFGDQGTRMVVDAFARRQADRRKGRAGWCSGTSPAEFGIVEAERTGRQAAEQAVRLLGTESMQTTELPVVLSAAAAGLLVHELLGHALEADAVAEGTSLVASMLGEVVTDSVVSVYDGCAAPGVWGAQATDDEGTPNPETELIRRGVFVGMLTDRRHGEASGGQGSSGNGRRQSFEHPVLPRVSRTRLARGRTSRDAMVAGLRFGLLVHGVEGGAVNARTGLLNVAVKEAQVIRDGEPTERVSGLALVGDARATFGSVRAVGDDPALTPMSCGKHGQWIPVSADSPSLLVERLRVVGG